MGIPDHLTCLLRNLYAGQEATIRTGHGTTDCFQIGKGVCQGCILSPCLFNLYAEYWRRIWQPTPVFLPGESHGRRSLVGYSPRGRRESGTTEQLHLCRVHHENAGLDEAHAGIKIAGRNINNLRYADDTTLMAESEEEVKSL